MKLAPFIAAIAIVIGTQADCTPAQGANVANIIPTVLADLIASKTIPQIEVDVAGLIGGPAGADIALIVQEAVTLLVDSGVVPANVLPYAREVQAKEGAKAAAHLLP